MEHKKKPGPDGDVLKVDGDWRDAVGKALKKARPATGWPERPVKKRNRRKSK